MYVKVIYSPPSHFNIHVMSSRPNLYIIFIVCTSHYLSIVEPHNQFFLLALLADVPELEKKSSASIEEQQQKAHVQKAVSQPNGEDEFSRKAERVSNTANGRETNFDKIVESRSVDENVEKSRYVDN